MQYIDILSKADRVLGKTMKKCLKQKSVLSFLGNSITCHFAT